MRIYGLSDCVIAVAFTLFIVNIRLPPEGLSESQLQSFIIHNILSGEIPFYLATYLVVASSWISHYRIFTYLKRSNSLFIILNVLFLASIVFLPVPVAFFYRYGNQTGSLLVFACTQLVTSVTLLLMWVVARVDHLLDPAIPPEYRRYTTARLVVIPRGILFWHFWGVPLLVCPRSGEDVKQVDGQVHSASQHCANGRPTYRRSNGCAH